jgi:hypothetical protein
MYMGFKRHHSGNYVVAYTRLKSGTGSADRLVHGVHMDDSL